MPGTAEGLVSGNANIAHRNETLLEVLPRVELGGILCKEAANRPR